MKTRRVTCSGGLSIRPRAHLPTVTTVQDDSPLRACSLHTALAVVPILSLVLSSYEPVHIPEDTSLSDNGVIAGRVLKGYVTFRFPSLLGEDDLG